MATEKITCLEQKMPKAEGEHSSASGERMKISAQWKSFLLATLLLVAGFSLPLYRLARFAAGNELFSYILLVPFIVWYLLRLKKKTMPVVDSKPMRAAGLVFLAAGAAVLTCYFMAGRSGAKLEIEDGLALVSLAFFLVDFGLAFALLGRATMRASAFPLGMLVFIVPFPVFMREGIENFLQHGSAYAASGMFKLSGMPYIRDGLILQLPGIPLRVAPECSGIHSSLILFITSLLAGYLFLRSPWKRAILTLAVIPLALLRNGFRIFTIGELCVHIGPHMIDSVIHRKGGPLFFVLSLIPFFALLALLHRSERRQKESNFTRL